MLSELGDFNNHDSLREHNDRLLLRDYAAAARFKLKRSKLKLMGIELFRNQRRKSDSGLVRGLPRMEDFPGEVPKYWMTHVHDFHKLNYQEEMK